MPYTNDDISKDLVKELRMIRKNLESISKDLHTFVDIVETLNEEDKQYDPVGTGDQEAPRE